MKSIWLKIIKIFILFVIISIYEKGFACKIYLCIGDIKKNKSFIKLTKLFATVK